MNSDAKDGCPPNIFDGHENLNSMKTQVESWWKLKKVSVDIKSTLLKALQSLSESNLLNDEPESFKKFVDDLYSQTYQTPLNIQKQLKITSEFLGNQYPQNKDEYSKIMNRLPVGKLYKRSHRLLGELNQYFTELCYAGTLFQKTEIFRYALLMQVGFSFGYTPQQLFELEWDSLPSDNDPTFMFQHLKKQTKTSIILSGESLHNLIFLRQKWQEKLTDNLQGKVITSYSSIKTLGKLIANGYNVLDSEAEVIKRPKILSTILIKKPNKCYL